MSIYLKETTKEDLRNFKLRLSLRQKEEATFDDAVQCLLEYWKRQTGDGEE